VVGLEVKSLDSPEETRPFADKGETVVVTVDGHPVLRATHEPGWRWSEHVKPIGGTDSCQNTHLGYVLSGRIHLVMDDGTESEAGPGDVFAVAPGHDDWVVGDEPCVTIDFGQVAR
jgi:quercetin dioxygenase-like cupin family protein